MGDLLSQPEFVETWAGGVWAFRALVENIEQCVYLLDSECRYLAINDAFRQWLARPESEILGRTVFDLWPRPLAVKEAAEHLRVLRGEHIEQEEKRPRGNDVEAASQPSVHIRKVPVRDDAGGVRGVLCLFHETSRAPVESGTAAVAPSASQARTTRTILVVDNERSILQLTQTILRAHGHRVLTAEDGRAAVEIYRQDPTTIDVVLVDQNMPGLSGLETMKQMLAINPQQRILLMTGGDPPEASWGVNNPRCGFLSKPWTTPQLLESVRDP